MSNELGNETCMKFLNKRELLVHVHLIIVIVFGWPGSAFNDITCYIFAASYENIKKI